VVGSTREDHVADGGVPVYNFEPEGTHTYAVTGRTWVHNTRVTGSASTSATQTPYTSIFEMELNVADLGRSRSVHFNRANAALDSALRSDPAFAQAMSKMIPRVRVT
jgi:hypothetical protein